MQDYDIINTLKLLMIRTIKNTVVNDKETMPKYSAKLDEASRRNQEEWANHWVDNTGGPSRYRYNLTISDSHQFLWFRNPKVGTRTLLKRFTDDENVSLTAVQARKCYYPMDFYKDYFKFAFVRDPWDRFYSGWRNKIFGKNKRIVASELHDELQDFNVFVKYYHTLDIMQGDLHFFHQHTLLDLNELDYVGRMESFEHDCHEIFTTLGLSTGEIVHKNRSPVSGQNYHRFYTEETAALIAEMYRKDIQLFGYRFNPTS